MEAEVVAVGCSVEAVTYAILEPFRQSTRSTVAGTELGLLSELPTTSGKMFVICSAELLSTTETTNGNADDRKVSLDCTSSVAGSIGAEAST
jgi:hypothetical protein